MRQCGIYAIHNIETGKLYIGQSVDMVGRWRGHLSELRRDKHGNRHLQGSFWLYGEENFEFIIIEILPENLLDEREKYWISYVKSMNSRWGYNNEDGGSLYKHASAEVKQRQSLAAKGRPKSQQMRDRLSKTMIGNKRTLGYHWSSHTKELLSIANKGQKRSAVTCARISQKAKENPVYAEHCRELADAQRGVSISLNHRIRISVGLEKFRIKEFAKRGFTQITFGL